MKKSLLLVMILGLAASAQASLKLGDSLTPYEIKNSRTGAIYCQICAYGAKPAKIIVFGKLEDPKFWEDLQKLQTLNKKYPKLGIFAQVIDSQDLAAVKKAAGEHEIKFPVVIPVEKDWDEAWQVKGVSRVLYYADKENKITWITVGLESKSSEQLDKKLAVDFPG